MTSGVSPFDPTKGPFYRGDIKPEEAKDAKKKSEEETPTIIAPPAVSEEQAATDAVKGTRGGKRRDLEKPIQAASQMKRTAPARRMGDFGRRVVEQSIMQGNQPVVQRFKPVKKETVHVETATFAGGCFWCIQDTFDSFPGVLSTTVGYTGGTEANPTYKDVCSGRTGHVEAIQVVYDTQKITYQQLLDAYWRSIDPTRGDGQFCDKGTQYRPIIFYHNENQRQEALASKIKLLETKAVPRVMVDILPAQTFYPAEEYHQKYYDKSYTRYESYYSGSGRSRRLKELWG